MRIERFGQSANEVALHFDATSTDDGLSGGSKNRIALRVSLLARRSPLFPNQIGPFNAHKTANFLGADSRGDDLLLMPNMVQGRAGKKEQKLKESESRRTK